MQNNENIALIRACILLTVALEILSIPSTLLFEFFGSSYYLDEELGIIQLGLLSLGGIAGLASYVLIWLNQPSARYVFLGSLVVLALPFYGASVYGPISNSIFMGIHIIDGVLLYLLFADEILRFTKAKLSSIGFLNHNTPNPNPPMQISQDSTDTSRSVCPQCGASLPMSAQFCGKCGFKG